jgi:pyruvate dehydrogenase E1 component beta subunit
MVHRALAAAETLALEDIEAEVIDPRTLNPLDEETILTSVRKTQRLVVVYEAYERCGIGAEIAALVASKAIDSLDAPIERVAALNTPVPFSPKLENYVIPNEERIIAGIKQVLSVAT